MEEEIDWSQISRRGKRSYINVRPHTSGAVSEILEKYGKLSTRSCLEIRMQDKITV